MSDPKKEYWPSEHPDHGPRSEGTGSARLDPEAPNLAIFSKGYIGIVPWVICTHGESLRIAIGRVGGGHVEIDVSTRAEMDQLLALAGALFSAHKEIA